jgi:hypothetical protein
MYQHEKGGLKKEKFTLSHTMYEEGRHFYLFFNLSIRLARMVNTISQPLYPPGNRPCTHCTGGWMGLGDSLDRYA